MDERGVTVQSTARWGGRRQREGWKRGRLWGPAKRSKMVRRLDGLRTELE